MTVADAASLVAEMAGGFRLPDALKCVDRLARGLSATPSTPIGAVDGVADSMRARRPDR
jgi:hypothetical protein